jgi:hypothetical protein
MSKLNKIVVCVLICALISLSLMQCRADVVFQDNFGSGNLNKWTVSGSPPSIVTAPVVDGSTYSLQFPSASTNSSTLTYIQAPFPQSNMATLEFYFQTDTPPPTSSEIGLSQVMCNINGKSDGSVSLDLSCAANGTLEWFLIYPYNESNGATSFQAQTLQSSIQVGAWCKVDIALAMSGNTRGIQLSIDDTPVFTDNSVQVSWSSTVFRLGPQMSMGYSSGNIYFDGVTITNSANIPVPTPTPSPTANTTVNPSPTATTSTPTATPSPANNANSSSQKVPEITWLAIIPLMASVFSVALVLGHRRTSQLKS